MNKKLVRYLAVWNLLTAVSLLLGYTLGVGGDSAEAASSLKIPNVKMSQIPQAPVGPPGRKAYTIYMGRGGEKIKAAQRMNALHELMAARGYTLQDTEPYVENADLEGWWITYVAEGRE